MAGYTIRTTDGTTLGTIADGTVDNTATSLTLVGRNFSNYGQIMTDNLVSIVENFAYDIPPSNPLEGQLWWDTDDTRLKVYTGTTFKVVSGATATSSAPNTTVAGDIWWDTLNDQLYVYNGTTPYNVTGWILVGPVWSRQQGRSGALREVIEDNLGTNHPVVTVWLDGVRQAILSDDNEFTPNVALTGFTTIKPGHNIATFGEFHGTANNAARLGDQPAANYLRSDINDSTTGTLAVQNDSGITVGADGDVDIAVSANAAVIRNNTVNGNIEFAVNVAGTNTTSLTVNGATGTVEVESIRIADSTLSTSTSTGALVIAGGAGVAGNLFVGEQVIGDLIGNVTGTATGLSTVLPVSQGGTGSSTATAARTALGIQINTDVQAYNTNLQAIGSLNVDGLIARTGTGTASAREIVGGDSITVVNGNGKNGNPTISLSTNANLTGAPTATTPPTSDRSTRVATTDFVWSFTSARWAGATTLQNVISTYSGFPIGTKVAFWDERNYRRPANSNGGSVAISDRYRRVVQKTGTNTWVDVGG